MKDKSELKIGDKVAGKNLNGKEIAGELVAIPVANPNQVVHVKTAGGIQFAKIDDVAAAEDSSKSTSKSTKPEPAKA